MSFIYSVLYFLDLHTFLIVVTILLLTCYALRQRDSRNLPPGPLMLPVVGTMITFALKERQCTSAFRAVAAWREEYGNIFRIRFGPREAVVIGSYKLVTEALRKHKRVFDARPVLRTFECIMHSHVVGEKQEGMAVDDAPIFPHSLPNLMAESTRPQAECFLPHEFVPRIGSSNGEMWQVTRKFVAGALRELGVGKKSLEQHIQEEASILIATLENEGKPLYPRDILVKAASNIILRICFGQRSEYNDVEFCEMLVNLHIVMATMGIQMLENFWPWIKYVRPLAKEPILKASDDVIYKYAMQRLQEHKATYDDAHIRDLTDLHIKERQNWTDKRMQTDFHVCRTVLDLIYAGVDTLAANLTWIILYMIHHPEIQTKCQNEIDEVVGGGRLVSLSDKPALVYNMAVINEILRHGTHAPLGAPREALEDIEIGGYIIPKGAIAIFDLDSVHRDKSYWGDDADAFRPQRWIDENGQLRTYDGFIPFSNGTRQCIGEPLAQMDAFLFFTNILQRLTFRQPEGFTRPPIEGIQSGIVCIPQEFYVISERR